MSTPIPAPPTLPFIGNVASIDKELSLNSFNLLARQYGEIVFLDLAGYKDLLASSYEILNEVSDEKRFKKIIHPVLEQVRNAVTDGLFTAHVPDEPNWFIAHRILMPAFSTANVLGMFDDMYDIVSQLVLKWERFGSNDPIDVSADFTRLTLDAIALCSMSYRLNSFYREELPPFAQAMGEFLLESGSRALRPSIVNTLMRANANKYQENIDIMMNLAKEILADRKAHPTDKKDLLTVMIEGRDKETGLGLSDDNVVRNLITFLVAGHETTSGLLSFVMYYLLRYPDTMRKLREEIDTKIGDRPMKPSDLHKLPYLLAVLRETLRLSPTAPLRTAAPLEDTTLLNGKYFVPKGHSMSLNIYMIHRDPRIWGDDAEEFRPERMLDGKFEAMPPNAWQPFGFGMRACIGRPFAWQEAQMALVGIMQRFDFVMHDPSYNLALRQTLTIKPKDFYIHAIPRAGKPRLLATPSNYLVASSANDGKGSVNQGDASQNGASPGQPLYVLYGSNAGSSESFAQRIAAESAAHGFRASIGTLDSAAGHLPKDGPLIIVTASFEGLLFNCGTVIQICQPADNAKQFVTWLTDLKGEVLKDIPYAVFGCGNREWAKTFQRVPTLIDQALNERGAKRLISRGEGDAGGSEFFESFDKWTSELWEELTKVYQTQGKEVAAGLKITTVDTGSSRATLLRQSDTAFGTVIENRVLTAPGAPEKRHIEFVLPEGMTYRAGDYLAIIPVNPPQYVHRVIAHFGLSAEQEITVSVSGPTSLPVNKPISIFNLLSGYVELSQPATTRDLRILGESANTVTSTAAIKRLSSSYSDEVIAKRLSVLDILELYPDIKISFEAFLQLLPAMRVRQYSISSSPLWNPSHVTLTISVIQSSSIAGRKEPFYGVASTYLASLRPGDKVQMAVRPSNSAFHLPSDPSVPLFLFAAGSGIAPLRGFLQERAIQAQSGRNVGKSLLYFGCRRPDVDFLYADDDLKKWGELGVVDVRPAFSQATSGRMHVQDRIWEDRQELQKAYCQGSKFYLCGSRGVATSVKEKLTMIIADLKQVDDESATKMFEEIMNGRFATDVFE
ncbi:bifunctional P-450/NADPH-P450 reductase [Panus rudis PR-1116 ss-1]|nr:bifunctional P-450/NADPH-P450 reductase [Panus rudis PR-1116 ss-1]